jgi:protein-tyrosine phosphatase
MLRKGYIDVAATDAHNVTSRPCRMRDGYQALQKRFGQEMADRLCIEFPGQI